MLGSESAMRWRRLDGRWGFASLLPAALLLHSCSSQSPRPAAAAESRLEPMVLTRPTPAPDGTLALAAIFPSAGRYALSGVQSLNGTRLAVDDVNRAGGVHG